MSDSTLSSVDIAQKEEHDPKKLRPPNKKKFEKDFKIIVDSIADKETHFKHLNGNADNVNRVRLEQQQKKTGIIDERKKINNSLWALNQEIGKRRDTLNKFRAGLYYQSELKINEAIGRLEYQLRTQNFKLIEEKKIVQEIDSLKRSKKSLKEYLTMKAELDSMRQQQQTMRDERDALYKKETQLKFKEEEMKKELSQLRTSSDEIKKDIDELYNQKRKLKSDFNKQCVDFGAAIKLKRQLSNKKRDEERRAHQEAMIREREEIAELADPYFEEKQICAALIHYLQRFVRDSSHSHSNAETPTEETITTSFKNIPPEEGMYILNKKNEEELFSGITRGRSSKKSKKDKRKITQNRPITHTPETLVQFAQLNIQAPATTIEIPATLDQLTSKKKYFESLQLISPSTPVTKEFPFILSQDEAKAACSTNTYDITSLQLKETNIFLNNIDQGENEISTICSPEYYESPLDTETASFDLDNEGSSVGDRQSLSRQVSDEVRNHMQCEELNSTDSGLTDTDMEEESVSMLPSQTPEQMDFNKNDSLELKNIIDGLSRQTFLNADVQNFCSSELVLNDATSS